MSKFKSLLLGFALLIGLSVSISAQRNDDQKKPPPKERPPTVDPKVKPPRPPRDDNKPKKPGSEYSLALREEQKNSA